MPLPEVVVVASNVPELLYSFTVTPEIPPSFVSCLPLELASLKTKFPIDEQLILATITTVTGSDIHPLAFLAVRL